MSLRFWKKKKVVAEPLDAEQLRRVVALIPEYVECLVEEGRLRGDTEAGLDGREFHGPAERKLKKIEARLAGILGRKPETGNLKPERILSREELSRLPGVILPAEQRGAQ